MPLQEPAMSKKLLLEMLYLLKGYRRKNQDITYRRMNVLFWKNSLQMALFIRAASPLVRMRNIKNAPPDVRTTNVFAKPQI